VAGFAGVRDGDYDGLYYVTLFITMVQGDCGRRVYCNGCDTSGSQQDSVPIAYRGTVGPGHSGMLVGTIVELCGTDEGSRDMKVNDIQYCENIADSGID